MKRIIGIISLITATGWLCYLIYLLIKEPFPSNFGSIFAIFSMICLAVSTLAYIILTNFGITDPKEIEKINFENKILKLQIEQKQLKKNLED